MCDNPDCPACSGKLGKDTQALNLISAALIDVLTGMGERGEPYNSSSTHAEALAMTLALIAAKAPNDVRNSFFGLVVTQLIGYFISISREMAADRGEVSNIGDESPPEDTQELLSTLAEVLARQKQRAMMKTTEDGETFFALDVSSLVH